MSFILKITNGLTDTVDFMDPTYLLMDGGLQITEPEPLQEWSDATPYSGPKLLSRRFGNRTATIKFQITSPTRYGLAQRLTKLGGILQQARDYVLGNGGNRVALLYSWDSDSYQSYYEVLDGTLTMPDNIMSVEQIHRTDGENFIVDELQLELTLSPCAYGTDGTAFNFLRLPFTDGLLNIYTPMPLGYTTFLLNLETWYNNFVVVPGDKIEGDAPAKCMIVISKMNFGSTGSHLKKIYVGCRHFPGPSFAVENPLKPLPSTVNPDGPVLTEEYFPAPNSSFAWVLNDEATGDPARYFTGSRIPQGSPDPITIFRIPLGVDATDYYGGQAYRLFLDSGPVERFDSRVLYRAAIAHGLTSNIIYTTPWTRINSGTQLLDLGSVPLPPFSTKIPDPGELTILIQITDLPVGTTPNISCPLDRIQLMPTADGFRSYTLRGQDYSLDGVYLIDDQWNGIAYTHSDLVGEPPSEENGFIPSPDYQPPKDIGNVFCEYGDFTLYPGKPTIFYFLFDGDPHNGRLQEYRIEIFYVPTYKYMV